MMKASRMMIGLVLAVALARAEAAPVAVAPNGATEVGAAGASWTALVRVETHEQEISVPPGGKPPGDRSSCTYSRVPCSVVDSIQVEVDGHALPVPRSVYADLADLVDVEVAVDGTMGRITLTGGDASESYVVTIEFDERRIKRRTVGATSLPEDLLQETVFHEVSVDD